MFYPIDSLKRGGRFYLCWVADSWPLRFATITHRQLWSQDIRRICDDLLEVMTNESGRPANRFSLRLSSQLMRGLVRLYQRKVTVFLGMILAKHELNRARQQHSNKKWYIQEVVEVEHMERPQMQQLPQIVIQEEPENEQRVEEMIQNSGNVVTNLQDITLKETTIPEFRLPPNDGFGEEHPEQPFQLLADRTLEVMLVPADGAAGTSGLELPGLERAGRGRDPARVPHDLQMEDITMHDVTMFRRYTGEGLLPAADLEKEILEIPEFPLLELPAPEPDKQREHHENIVPVQPDIIEPRVTAVREQEPAEIELEELDQIEPQPKRRRLRDRLIIDKKIKLSGNTLRARIENPAVDLRCEDSSEDIISIRIPFDAYMRRPCHGGAGLRSNVASVLRGMFMRNLGVAPNQPRADRELEEAVMQHPHTRSRSMLERIEEVEETILPIQIPQMEHTEVNVTMEGVMSAPRVSVVEQRDISDLLTQKIDTLSQRAKRTAQYETVPSPKRQKSIGYVSFRESQIAAEKSVSATEPAKDQIPDFDLPIEEQDKAAEKSVTAMLQEAGLADIQPYQAMDVETQPTAGTQRKSTRRLGSEGSETPLGSLDRTKVSLGDSEQTTDSKRFIRDQWGTEGTMIKILKSIKEGHTRPVNVWNLIAKGPLISGYKSIIAARCFTSILKLKQHGFISIVKWAETLEIKDITLGPKFD